MSAKARRCLVGTLIPLFGLACASTGPASPPPLAGLRATLEDTTVPYIGNGIQRWRWQTHWLLQWQPVAGASEYEIIAMTSEGTSKKTTRQKQPPYRIEVAKGDNVQTEGMPTRDIQLLTIESLLSIKVVARMTDGSAGPSSPWLQVGRLYP